MAIKYICDRCASEHVPVKQRTFDIPRTPLNIVAVRIGPYSAEIALCKSCCEDILPGSLAPRVPGNNPAEKTLGERLEDIIREIVEIERENE